MIESPGCSSRKSREDRRTVVGVQLTHRHRLARVAWIEATCVQPATAGSGGTGTFRSGLAGSVTAEAETPIRGIWIRLGGGGPDWFPLAVRERESSALTGAQTAGTPAGGLSRDWPLAHAERSRGDRPALSTFGFSASAQGPAGSRVLAAAAELRWGCPRARLTCRSSTRSWWQRARSSVRRRDLE